VVILGDAGSSWLLVYQGGSWALYVGDDLSVPDAEVTIGQEDAWQLFTRSITRSEVLPRVTLSGNMGLGSKVLGTVALIA